MTPSVIYVGEEGFENPLQFIWNGLPSAAVMNLDQRCFFFILSNVMKKKQYADKNASMTPRRRSGVPVI